MVADITKVIAGYFLVVTRDGKRLFPLKSDTILPPAGGSIVRSAKQGLSGRNADLEFRVGLKFTRLQIIPDCKFAQNIFPI